MKNGKCFVYGFMLINSIVLYITNTSNEPVRIIFGTSLVILGALFMGELLELAQKCK